MDSFRPCCSPPPQTTCYRVSTPATGINSYKEYLTCAIAKANENLAVVVQRFGGNGSSLVWETFAVLDTTTNNINIFDRRLFVVSFAVRPVNGVYMKFNDRLLS